jgi:hypothetical protein
MVCIDGPALFLKVEKCFSRPSLSVIFGAFCWRSFEDDFMGFFVGVTYEDLVPFWLVTLPPNLP